MKTFNSIEEMKKYYNKNTNTYDFIENGVRLDVEFTFKLSVDSHIYAYDINAFNINTYDIRARNITAMDINAGDITARNITAFDIDALDINAFNINAGDITAKDIDTLNITAKNITAKDINAGDITARDITAFDIDAGDISYYAVCYAYQNLTCKSIKGRREKSNHFVLDGEIRFKPVEKL
jgi:hypothetical protein